MLAYAEQVKNHYNGYLFGTEAIYCPWDVMCFCQQAMKERALAVGGPAHFGNYWANTSHNAIIDEFIEYADNAHVEHLRALMAGRTVFGCL